MLNMDFGKRVVLDTQQLEWVASPRAGVWRKPLAREEAEQGHATSIVKYEPNSSFSAHDHPKGEEILVLKGVFSDETGDYHAGSYFRNPEGFRHAPFSKEGCILLVKLHQFQKNDDKKVCIDTHYADWLPGKGKQRVLPLHQHQAESVALILLPAGEHLTTQSHNGGGEIYVISGELIDDLGRYPAGSWIRNPDMSHHNPHVERETLIYVKTGHLHI
ncbi:MAG: anti-sigma factor ChrR (cupin superfamily) [Oceanicoccus sp.]|jgi:anti-sigma factor ChrR (cupin superfamily)